LVDRMTCGRSLIGFFRFRHESSDTGISWKVR
jgi:hypothetical protein